MAQHQTRIFVNFPVKDLEKAKAFFSSLGFTFNPQFTDEKAACLVISDTIFAMLLKEEFFKTFTKRDLADARRSTETIIALSVESRERVDDMVRRGVASGGAEAGEAQDHGWMYYRTLSDPDGHLWEFTYMDEAAVAQGAR